MAIYLQPGSLKEPSSIYVGAGEVKTVNSVYVGAGGVYKVWPNVYDLGGGLTTSNWIGAYVTINGLIQSDVTLSSASGGSSGTYLYWTCGGTGIGGFIISTTNKIDFSTIDYVAVDIGFIKTSSSQAWLQTQFTLGNYQTSRYSDGVYSCLLSTWPDTNPNGNSSLYFLIDCRDVTDTTPYYFTIYQSFSNDGNTRSYTGDQVNLYDVKVGTSTNPNDYGDAFATYGFNYTLTMKAR